MSEAPSPQKTVNVLTIGMDSRKQAIFRMAFKMHTLHHYRLIEDLPNSPPHLAIFDFDRPDATSAWQTFRAEHPTLPALIVTVEPPAAAPAPVLPKPIRMENLFPQLRQLLAGDPLPAPNVSGQPAQTAPAAAPPTAPPEPAPAAQAAPPRPAPAPVAWPDDIEYFDPRQGLLGALLQARRTGSPSVISIAGNKALIALPEHDRVIPLHTEHQLHEACLEDDVAVGSQPLTAEDTAQAEPLSLTGLLWQVALWTCRGRLIAGFPDQAPIRLRHWPNLTRLAPSRNGLRIAAFWSRSPVNLRLTVRLLGLPPAQVFNFLAASYSIGLLDSTLLRNGAAAPQPAAVAAPPEAAMARPAAANERSGFLSRLLKKVAGL